MAAPPTLPRSRPSAPPEPAYVRLASCPHCSGRRRVLIEVGGDLQGRCLGCGAELSVPLATERTGRMRVVGRAGQGIVEIGSDD
ncbi:MAG TPA: hypothetical protein VMU20_00840 [Candidatus Dormibacteraeota bacterium]|jgi:hypothetical protein|nr:hypothetical protein [Candidatus Dormibacteraeota bacterium]